MIQNVRFREGEVESPRRFNLFWQEELADPTVLVTLRVPAALQTVRVGDILMHLALMYPSMFPPGSLREVRVNNVPADRNLSPGQRHVRFGLPPAAARALRAFVAPRRGELQLLTSVLAVSVSGGAARAQHPELAEAAAGGTQATPSTAPAPPAQQVGGAGDGGEQHQGGPAGAADGVTQQPPPSSGLPQPQLLPPPSGGVPPGQGGREDTPMEVGEVPAAGGTAAAVVVPGGGTPSQTPPTPSPHHPPPPPPNNANNNNTTSMEEPMEESTTKGQGSPHHSS